MNIKQQQTTTTTNATTTILHNAVVVTMDPHSHVYTDGAVAIEDDRIVSIGRSSQILHDFSHSHPLTLDLRRRLVLPGLINTHVHTSQQLGRGIADDVDLVTWLHDRIWPYESNMTEEDSYISTLLCGIELIRSGVTCFAEAGGQHVSGMVKAVDLLGMRACLAESIMDAGEGLPPSWGVRTTDDCIQKQKDLFEKYNNTADGRIRIWLGIRQIMNSTDSLLTQTRDLAKELNTGIHMHVAEIPYENHFVKDTRGAECGTVSYLDKIEFLQSNLLAAHSVWVNETEVGFLSKSGVKVSHCPAAAMRMLGFAPIKEMINSGVCVSLGTDGAPSNNRMSIVDEMYLASLINKGREAYVSGSTDPTALSAEMVLKMVTVNGAKSVLWDNEIGTLEPGKKADLIVVDPFSWSMVPVHDSISSLVYSMRTENIISVMCNGRWIMKNRKILSVDEVEVLAKAKDAARELVERAGIKIPSRMNFV